MMPQIPRDIPQNVGTYLRSLVRHVQIEFNSRTPDLTAKRSVILLSPDGSAWEITVANDGAVESTKVQG